MMKPDGYLYPPPKKASGKIRACVVEKKGDETRTSMRQSEIYAYSPDIRIRDGYMVMPKYFWGSFSPGDWFWTKPIYAVDRFNEQGDERELSELEKIDPAEYKVLKIPPTKFEHGIVRIKCAFVFCPEFIRNKEIRNTYGSYKKLYVLNMGQGFVHNSKAEFKLNQDTIHIGIFEFRAKDNGAVNFSHRSEIRDHTNHVLERDSMWELRNVVAETVSNGIKQEMKIALESLLNLAQEFDKEIEDMKMSMKPSSLLDDSMANLTVRESLHSNMNTSDISNVSVPPSQTSSTEEQLDDSNDVTLTNPNELVFHTMEELEAYRKEVIVLTKCSENGMEITKWMDNETGETCTDDDILIFKFHSRHEITAKTEEQAAPTKQIVQESVVERNETTFAVERNETTIAQNQIRHRTFSTTSIRSNVLGVPLASSTPMPTPLATPHQSPEPQRRRMTFPNIFGEHGDDTYNSTQNFTAHMNQTRDTVLLCRDVS
uniref:IRS-type PTB domain-containing protein n=1 Tax=Caenorhabditis tropicalis TaxID=1561998 RepID=A0A1I7U7E7_9PELO